MDHKELDVWKVAMELVEDAYRISAKFPDHERYGLTSQLRRSAISIPSNISEGSGRKSNKELIQFLSISLGSLAELETQYLIAIRLEYIKKGQFLGKITRLRKLLIGFRNHIKKQN